MTQLMLLLFIVVGTYGALSLLSKAGGRWDLSRSLRGRISLAMFFVFTGASHFYMPEELARLLPASLPLRMEMIYVTGVLEILGAIGLLVPGLERLASLALIAFLLGVLPSNIYGAINHVDVGAHAAGPVYLLARVPFQVFLMGWAYYFGLKLLPRSHAPWHRSTGRLLRRAAH